jgi:phospholipase C
MSTNSDRRRFLKMLAAGAAASAALPASIKRALALPANHRTGTIEDVEHVIFFMQENRAFDHYFGSLRGVRGFGDPIVPQLPDGDPVWAQPNGTGKLFPFHPDAPNLGLQFMVDLAHGWTDQHKAWNEGKYDQWVAAKGTTTMAHFTRNDIPFHYALADAFTVCDAYHCSLIGPTDPNRYHMWTGWVGNDGKGGGPVVDNAEAGYDWHTYPERLTNAGISWKVYQDVGDGLDAADFWGFTDDAFIGNFGDNSLLYFHQFQNAQPGSPLFESALTGTNILNGGTLFDVFKKDVMTNTLPQVSYIVAPEGYCEHGNWPANFGAWYTSQILDILTSNPEVWSKTALIFVFDENDGLFDHMIPPTPPQTRAQGLSNVDTTNEIFPGSTQYAAGPYGLGFRVPMIVISPWSKGGWVNSELFDHTSLIRFLEARFAKNDPNLVESNITAWRRAIVGDLTSAFDFRKPDDNVPSFPSTAAYVPPDENRHADYVPTLPTNQSVPKQEPGVRPARALPYELHVHAETSFSENSVKLTFHNGPQLASVFQVRSQTNTSGPWTYTVAPHTHLFDTWQFGSSETFDLQVFGPNGFVRTFRGSLSGKANANLAVRTQYDTNADHPGITLEIHNRGDRGELVIVRDVFGGPGIERFVQAGDTLVERFSLDRQYGWYDLVVDVDGDTTFEQRLRGHVETGEDSVSDPALGG